jgi:hypothetical protein
LTIFRNERMTPYTNLASSSKGNPVPEAAPLVTAVGGGGGGGGVRVSVPEGEEWLASPNATTTPEVEERVLRGLEKGVDPDVGVPGRSGGETACETPGRRVPLSLARLGRMVRCCQSW